MPIYSGIAAAADLYSYAGQWDQTFTTGRRSSDFASPSGLRLLGGHQIPPSAHPEDELLTHSIDLASRARCLFAIISSK